MFQVRGEAVTRLRAIVQKEGRGLRRLLRKGDVEACMDALLNALIDNHMPATSKEEIVLCIKELSETGMRIQQCISSRQCSHQN